MKAAGAILCALAALLACEPREPAPIPALVCPSTGAPLCANDRECPGGFCDIEGCCIPLEGQCPRRAPPGFCDAPTCINSLPGAIRDGAPECDDGLSCVIDDGRGACVEPAAPASCVVVGGVAFSERPFRMEALALDDAGAPAAFAPAATWSADRGAFAGDELTAACAGPDVCLVEVTAQLGTATCASTVRVFPLVPDGDTRVVVVDARTRRPLDGARVDMLVDGAFVTLVTDSDGAARTRGAARVVTVLPDAHERHTVLEPPDDIVIVTREVRAPTARSGTVNFDGIHTQGDIKLALTGFSLPSLVDASVADFLGVSEPTVVELEGITDPGGELMPLPSSLTVQLGDNPIHNEWTAFGDGALVWNFGVQVPLAEVGPVLTEFSANNSFGTAMRVLVPFLARGDHFVGLSADVVTPNTVAAITQDLAVPAHDATDTLGIAFARVAGGSFVPLGIGSEGIDVENGPPPGVLRVDFAPPHDGLEGSDVIVAAIALDLDQLSDPTAQLPMQMVTAPLGDELPAFLPLLEGTFDGVAFAAANDPGADLYRVRFDGWTVWSTTPPRFAIDELHAGDVVFTTTAARADAIAGAFDMQELDASVRAISTRPVQ